MPRQGTPTALACSCPSVPCPSKNRTNRRNKTPLEIEIKVRLENSISRKKAARNPVGKKGGGVLYRWKQAPISRKRKNIDFQTNRFF